MKKIFVIIIIVLCINTTIYAQNIQPTPVEFTFCQLIIENIKMELEAHKQNLQNEIVRCKEWGLDYESIPHELELVRHTIKHIQNSNFAIHVLYPEVRSLSSNIPKSALKDYIVGNYDNISEKNMKKIEIFQKVIAESIVNFAITSLEYQKNQ